MNKIRLKKNIFIQKLKQNFVILNEENGKYFLVNDTSIQIINILKEMTDINEIIDSFQKVYSIDEATAQTDVNLFLKEALKYEIIEII